MFASCWPLMCAKVDPSSLQVGSLRTGEVGLQALKLEPSALDILRQDQVQIQLRLSGESVIVGHRHGRSPPAHTAAADDFLAVEARITTKSGTSSLHWLSVVFGTALLMSSLPLAQLCPFVFVCVSSSSRRDRLRRLSRSPISPATS